jgi:hypothetical protein
MPKCLQSHVWWPWEKQGPQGCFAFFIPWSKIRVLQKWKKLLEKNKAIEKNEYEKEKKKCKIWKKVRIKNMSWNKNIQKKWTKEKKSQKI